MFGWTEEKRNNAFSVVWLERKREENGWKEGRAHQFFRFFFSSKFGWKWREARISRRASLFLLFNGVSNNYIFGHELLGHKSKIPKQRKILTFLMHMGPTTICLFGDEI